MLQSVRHILKKFSPGTVCLNRKWTALCFYWLATSSMVAPTPGYAQITSVWSTSEALTRWSRTRPWNSSPSQTGRHEVWKQCVESKQEKFVVSWHRLNNCTIFHELNQMQMSLLGFNLLRDYCLVGNGFVGGKKMQCLSLKNLLTPANVLFEQKHLFCPFFISGIRVWDVISELVCLCTVPSPSNPFALDMRYIKSLPLPDRFLVTGALLNFLEMYVVYGNRDELHYDKGMILISGNFGIQQVVSVLSNYSILFDFNTLLLLKPAGDAV